MKVNKEKILKKLKYRRGHMPPSTKVFDMKNRAKRSDENIKNKERKYFYNSIISEFEDEDVYIDSFLP